jgi:hypothetical protein
MSAEHRAMLEKRIAELKSRIGEGGLREAAIRTLLYIGSARGMVDERSIEALRQVRRDYSGPRVTLPEFKMLVREQFFMLLLDQEGASAAIPKLLPEDVNQRRAVFAAMRKVRPPAAKSRVSAPRDCSASQGFSAWMQRKVQREGRMLPLSIKRRKRRNAGWKERERDHFIN